MKTDQQGILLAAAVHRQTASSVGDKGTEPPHLYSARRRIPRSSTSCRDLHLPGAAAPASRSPVLDPIRRQNPHIAPISANSHGVVGLVRDAEEQAARRRRRRRGGPGLRSSALPSPARGRVASSPPPPSQAPAVFAGGDLKRRRGEGGREEGPTAGRRGLAPPAALEEAARGDGRGGRGGGGRRRGRRRRERVRVGEGRERVASALEDKPTRENKCRTA